MAPNTELVMREAFESSTVAVVLTEHEQPRTFALPNVPEREIELNGLRFEDSGLGDWLGFYDWLRTTSGNVIGVRLWLDEWNSHVDALGMCMNVSVPDGKKQVLVHFGAERDFEPAASDDQDFGANRLFIGEGYALTFNSPVSR